MCIICPFNTFAPFCFQTQVEETASKEIYEDTYSLLREILTEESFKISGGVTGSFKFSPSEGSMSNATLNVSLEGEYKQSKMIKEITEIKNVTVNVNCSSNSVS